MSATEPSNQPEVKPNADEDASQDSAPLMASIDPEVLLKILAQPEDQPHCLQEYCPLYESVAWDLSRQYWDARGAGAFSSGDVPFIVNNDGRLSADAALLFVEQLEAAEADGSLEPEWFVLELGAGSGLFAKQFLDVLRRESETRGRDYYQRTTYVLTDGS
ncbi:MAG: hypothetical protein O7G85_05780, partial [Planctomycetota bacterium]|nr:hypothetical protein [Planctomycetota bacterium]